MVAKKIKDSLKACFENVNITDWETGVQIVHKQHIKYLVYAYRTNIIFL